jgi:hypothetical protein
MVIEVTGDREKASGAKKTEARRRKRKVKGIPNRAIVPKWKGKLP